MIAYRIGDFAVFLFGFVKSDRDNITPDELEVLKTTAARGIGDAGKIAKDAEAGILVEAERTDDEIRALREQARMSQAVFARRLQLTAGYISQLERGAKRLTGLALVLLDVIRRKGIEAII